VGKGRARRAPKPPPATAAEPPSAQPTDAPTPPEPAPAPTPAAASPVPPGEAPGEAPTEAPAAPGEMDTTGLPPLELPASWTPRDAEFQQWADSRRRLRIRNEVIGGGAMILLGAILSVVLRTTGFFLLGLLGAAGLLAYEFLVSSFE